MANKDESNKGERIERKVRIGGGRGGEEGNGHRFGNQEVKDIKCPPWWARMGWRGGYELGEVLEEHVWVGLAPKQHFKEARMVRGG